VGKNVRNGTLPEDPDEEKDREGRKKKKQSDSFSGKNRKEKPDVIGLNLPDQKGTSGNKKGPETDPLKNQPKVKKVESPTGDQERAKQWKQHSAEGHGGDLPRGKSGQKASNEGLRKQGHLLHDSAQKQDGHPMPGLMQRRI
jgi:hypothetical protein